MSSQIQYQFPTMIRVGADYFALERTTLRFGRFDPASGQFTPIGTTPLPCCGSFGLAYDGRMVFTARQGGGVVIATIDPVTGEPGTLVPITGAPTLHVEELRFFAGRLYASSRDGTLVTIDPSTGATSVVPVPIGRVHAMELFEPRPAQP